MFLDRLILPDLNDEGAIWAAWDKLLGRRLPVLDPSLGDPDLALAMGALEAGRWDRLEALYRDRSPDEAHHLIEALGQLWPMDRPLPRGATGAVQQTVAGGILTLLGWRVRGGGMAHQIPKSRFERMEEYHRAAKDLLDKARGRDGGDVVTLGMAFSAAMGLSDWDDLDALPRHINAARERCLATDLQVQLGLCEKWFGHQDTMWDHARDIAQTGPEWLCLLVSAHIEDWRYYNNFQDAEPEDVAAWKARFKAPDYIPGLLDLQARFLQGVADHPLGTTLLRAHNVMGAAMATLVNWKAARPHLEAIGPRFHEISWCYIQESDDPMVFLNLLRRRAGLKPLFDQPRV